MEGERGRHVEMLRDKERAIPTQTHTYTIREREGELLKAR